MKYLKLFLTSIMLAIVGTNGAYAQGIAYIDRQWDEASKRVIEREDTCKNYETFSTYDGIHDIGDGKWYVVRGHQRQNALQVNGVAHLILCDGALLDLKRVKLDKGSMLHIYAQKQGNGRLVARNTAANGGYEQAAGIGGGKDTSMGVLHIHGGTVIGHGYANAAGIGGGINGYGGFLYVYGGFVEGHAGTDAAGIGGGETGHGQEVHIYGGTVWGWGYAEGGADRNSCYGAGIGGGQDGSSGIVEVYGGDVHAFGGMDAAGIGTGEETLLGDIHTDRLSFYGGTVHAEGRGLGVGIGAGEGAYCHNVEIYGGVIHAIGSADNSGDPNGRAVGMYNDSGTGTAVIFGDDLVAWEEGNISPAKDRSYFCCSRRDVHMNPCDHPGGTVTDNGDGTHTFHCQYCALGTYPHELCADGCCTICDYDANGSSLERTVTTENGLRHALKNGAVITLGADITLGSMLAVTEGMNVTLDLGGKTLARALKARESEGHVLQVNPGGKLTLKDSSPTASGRVTGGYADNGGGIWVGGEFLFQSGTFTGSQANYGGAIAIRSGGVVKMTGGRISGNTAFADGGGVWIENGTFAMEGGTITDNVSEAHGSGIWNGSTLSMQGAANVSGNKGTGANVYLPKDRVITVTGSLEGANVGVTAEVLTATLTKDYAIYNKVDSLINGDGGLTTVMVDGELRFSNTATAITKGTGTAADPYLIENSRHWQWLAEQTGESKTFYGKYFRMTGDIETMGTMVLGTFEGHFDGGGHTLRYNAGSKETMASVVSAPFRILSGATISHLNIVGDIYTDQLEAAGLATIVNGNDSTMLTDVTSYVNIHSSVAGEASHGGLIAENDGILILEECRFLGSLQGSSTSGCGGLVGLGNKEVVLRNCFVSPTIVTIQSAGSYTLARMTNGVTAQISDSYYGQPIGQPQGSLVFCEVKMPEGCTATIEGDPVMTFGGKSYYKSGTWMTTTTPDHLWFDHWVAKDGVFVSDPWAANGRHRLEDISSSVITLEYTPYAVEPETERDYFGVKYRYLSRRDYHLYISEAYRVSQGWYFEGDEEDANLMVKNSKDEKSEVTMVSGFVESGYEDGVATIMNDCVGAFTAHTHLGGIAPRAFEYSFGLKKVRFMDTDANIYNQLLPFSFFIGEQAFLGCENMTQLQLVQYITEGTNHYEALRPYQVTGIADNIFDGCSPKTSISIHANEYKNFLTSEMWYPYRSRLVVHEFNDDDFIVNGVKYHVFRNASNSEQLKNDAEGIASMTETLKWWNSEYQQFNAAELLNTYPDNTVYYTSIAGVDNDDIDGAGGVMRIYNDPGSFYNYKTIQLGRDAIRGNDHVKYIEFWQTNGSAENSLSDMKMVIPNGSLAGLRNLKELRLFYYVQDGSDHWASLGPKDVIPGNNIFSTLSVEEMENLTDEKWQNLKIGVPNDFKIIVASDRMAEFINDPNWLPYLGLMECRDTPNAEGKAAFRKDNVVYDYVTAPGGIVQSTSVASQDVSWYTLPRIGVEAALWGYVIYKFGASIYALRSMRNLPGAVAAKNLAATAEVIESELVFLEPQYLKAFKAIWGALGGGMVKIQSAYTTTISEKIAEEVVEGALDYVLKSSLSYTLTDGGKMVVAAILGFSTSTLSQLGLNLSDNFQNLKKLKEMGVIKGDQFICTPDMLKNMTMQELMILGQTMYNAMGVTFELARRNEEQLMNRLNDQLNMVNPNWNATTARNASIDALTAGILAKDAWGGTDSYNLESFTKGMREQILSNMDDNSIGAGTYVLYHLQKNLVNHVYVKEVDDVPDITLYVGRDDDGSYKTSDRLTTFGKHAFRNKQNLRTIKFHENTDGATSNASSPFLCVIPDSAFVGCPNLTELNLILETEENGQRALGPENFIFGGDSIFCTVDSTKFHIVIDPERKDDFLASASWSPLAKYFTYRSAEAKPISSLSRYYGANYVYAYEQNSIKKEHKVNGHLVEHVFANQADDDFLRDHEGALKLCIDMGTYNNYQLDYVRTGAFRGNPNLRYVNFTDLYDGSDCYSDFDIQLKDSCFADCANLKYFDLLFLKTDGVPNQLIGITPSMLKAGKGIFANTNVKLRMFPYQVKMFEEADSTWSQYKDRFLPCIIKPGDEYVLKAFQDMAYKDRAQVFSDDNYWYDYIDLTRFAEITAEKGSESWFAERIAEYKDDIRTLGDFKHFESVGLDHIGDNWFLNCGLLSNIELPNTVKTIGSNAFANCISLTEITLPTSIQDIRSNAFGGCLNLKTIVVPCGQPADIHGEAPFGLLNDLRIYVPDSVVNLYKERWSYYKDYIFAMSGYHINKVVTVTEPGQLAEKLGLTVIEDSYPIFYSQVRWIEGPYSKYDSLTVSGPLNGKDIAVLRYMMGADAWDSNPTDGQLRYLNLWNADLKKDERWSYNLRGLDEYLLKDNWVGEFMFQFCSAIETVILPKSVTEIGENAFEGATSLRRIVVGRKTTKYTCDLLQDLMATGGIEELAFVTDSYATSEDGDAWEAPIQRVYVPNGQIDSYMTDINLTSRAQSICAPFKNDHVLYALADKGGAFFPSEYYSMTSIDGVFTNDTDLKEFSEFNQLTGVTHLGDRAFSGCSNMTTVSLPSSLQGISKGAFDGCKSLHSIYVSTDSIFTLEPDVFEMLPDSFRIYVPKRDINTYLERWSQYKDHIVIDQTDYSQDDIITVRLTRPNTLHEALGLTITLDDAYWLQGVKGDYSKVKRLKIVGPISGTDFELLRYLAGYTLWTKERNYFGQLEYLDLYDAQIVRTFQQGTKETSGGVIRCYADMYEDVMHIHALKRAYSLKTLILPKTCKKVQSQAFLECTNLETVVFGDNTKEIEWNCFDDCVGLAYVYMLQKQLPDISIDFSYRLNNNFLATCNAMYVRPSLYQDYVNDGSYTVRNGSVQYTNAISKGAFNDDESFSAFAQHAVASQSDLITVRKLDGWFDNHTGIKDLTQLRYTNVSNLKKADFQKLTQLERIALPISTDSLETGLFQNSPLRFADMMAVEPSVVDQLKDGGLEKLGIDLNKTLCYVPLTYGSTEETNVVSGMEGVGLFCHHYSLYDGWDYTVPYAFQTNSVENSRTLAARTTPYTVCLPYQMEVPEGTKAYQLSDLDIDQVVFTEIVGPMEPLQPYLLKIITDDEDAESSSVSLSTDIPQTIPASGVNTIGQQVESYGYAMRGTLETIDNKTASEMYAYVLQSDGVWRRVGSDTEEHKKSYIPPYRSFLLSYGGNGAPNLGMILEDNTTAIEQIDTVKTIDLDGTERIYNLNGLRLERIPERGLYIKNGKKYLAK